MAKRNQCDGCQAGRPRVTLKNGEWVIDPNGKTHIMAKTWIALGGAVSYFGYPDLMGCTAHLYSEVK